MRILRTPAAVANSSKPILMRNLNLFRKPGQAALQVKEIGRPAASGQSAGPLDEKHALNEAGPDYRSYLLLFM